MPGFHSPDGQANVKMKSLEQSLTRCLSPKRHVIDYNETKLHKVSYTGLRAYSASPRGSPLIKIVLQSSSIQRQGLATDSSMALLSEWQASISSQYHLDLQDLWSQGIRSHQEIASVSSVSREIPIKSMDLVMSALFIQCAIEFLVQVTEKS